MSAAITRTYSSLRQYMWQRRPQDFARFRDDFTFRFDRPKFTQIATNGGRFAGSFHYERDVLREVPPVPELAVSPFGFGLGLADLIHMYRPDHQLPGEHPLVAYHIAYEAGKELPLPPLAESPRFDPVYAQPSGELGEVRKQELPRFRALLETLFPVQDFTGRTYVEYGFGREVWALSAAASLGMESIGFELEERYLARLERSTPAPVVGVRAEADTMQRYPLADLAIWSNLDPVYEWLPWDVLSAHVKPGGFLAIVREWFTMPQLPPERAHGRWKLIDRRKGQPIPAGPFDQRTDIWQRVG